MINRQRFFITAEVADLCRVRAKTVRRWCERGVIEASRLGHRWLITRSAVAAVLARADRQAVEEVHAR